MQHAEREITEPVALCDDKGLLNPEAIGFARQPFIQSNLKNHFMRKKKWNYWCVYGEDLLFSATISHLDYAAVCFVYILDYETQRFYEKQITIPIGRNVKMPENVLDSVKFVNDNLTVQIVHIQGETHLSVNQFQILTMKCCIYAGHFTRVSELGPAGDRAGARSKQAREDGVIQREHLILLWPHP